MWSNVYKYEVYFVLNLNISLILDGKTPSEQKKLLISLYGYSYWRLVLVDLLLQMTEQPVDVPNFPLESEKYLNMKVQRQYTCTPESK